MSHPLLPLGLPHLDGVLGGGLALGALHEAAARGPGAEGALTGFALALAARAAFQLKRPVLMVQHELAELEAGSLYAPGLAELGLCGGALVLVRVRKAQDVLFAMEEGLKCGGLSAVLGEVGTAFPEALTATRRLSLAARAHPVLGLLLRQRPDAAACAALTRWVVTPAASTPHDAHGGLGLPTLEAALMRNRLGPLGRWTLCLAGPAFLSAEARPALHRPAREAGS
ncbi:DNA repair protein [Xanthobacter sp. VTT E-85241]|uniref:ImuA family protein n=1 Tax=Roseixanthobacter finlandensis TaxID=3119922 RepID=UPI003729FB62